MASRMVFTAVGRDCPGIVAAVTKVLFECGCNIEDSSMSILRGEFAMILIVNSPDQSQLPKAQSELAEVEKKYHLLASFRNLPDPTEEIETPSELASYVVSVYGADKPGIVYQVAHSLAESSINITDVTTRIVGKNPQVYIMLLEVQVPSNLNASSFEEKMRHLATQLEVDISVRPQEIQAL